MLAVRKVTPVQGISMEQVAAPEPPTSGEVIIEVIAAGICGSDLHVYQWTAGYEFMSTHFPVTLGHEFSGRVHALGNDVKGLSEGTLVSVMPSFSCMRCTACASGTPHLCLDRRTIGLTQDGAFTRFVKVPALSCIPLPDHIDPVLAALIEPLAVGDNAAAVGEIQFGDTVVVLGPGTIGQAIIRAAQWRGANRIIAVGMNDTSRLQTALKLGATHTIDLAQDISLQHAVREICGEQLPDVVIEATGRPESVRDGLSSLKKGGIFVSAGIHAEPVTFDLTSFVRNRHQLRAAHGSNRRSWKAIAMRIADDPDAVRPMVSLVLPLDKAQEGFERSLARDVSKVVLSPSVSHTE